MFSRKSFCRDSREIPARIHVAISFEVYLAMITRISVKNPENLTTDFSEVFQQEVTNQFLLEFPKRFL